MRCDGARETHWATRHSGVTPSKTKEILKSPCFLDLNGILNSITFFTIFRIKAFQNLLFQNENNY